MATLSSNPYLRSPFGSNPFGSNPFASNPFGSTQPFGRSGSSSVALPSELSPTQLAERQARIQASLMGRTPQPAGNLGSSILGAIGAVTPDIVEKGVGQVAEAAIYAVPGLAMMGVGLGKDVANVLSGGFTRGHGFNVDDYVTGMAKAVYEDFRHPLRNPGYLALDLLAIPSMGASIATRLPVGAAALATRRGVLAQATAARAKAAATEARLSQPTSWAHGVADDISRAETVQQVVRSSEADQITAAAEAASTRLLNQEQVTRPARGAQRYESGPSLEEATRFHVTTAEEVATELLPGLRPSKVPGLFEYTGPNGETHMITRRQLRELGPPEAKLPTEAKPSLSSARLKAQRELGPLAKPIERELDRIGVTEPYWGQDAVVAIEKILDDLNLPPETIRELATAKLGERRGNRLMQVLGSREELAAQAAVEELALKETRKLRRSLGLAPKGQLAKAGAMLDRHGWGFRVDAQTGMITPAKLGERDVISATELQDMLKEISKDAKKGPAGPDIDLSLERKPGVELPTSEQVHPVATANIEEALGQVMDTPSFQMKMGPAADLPENVLETMLNAGIKDPQLYQSILELWTPDRLPELRRLGLTIRNMKLRGEKFGKQKSEYKRTTGAKATEWERMDAAALEKAAERIGAVPERAPNVQPLPRHKLSHRQKGDGHVEVLYEGRPTGVSVVRNAGGVMRNELNAVQVEEAFRFRYVTQGKGTINKAAVARDAREAMFPGRRASSLNAEERGRLGRAVDEMISFLEEQGLDSIESLSKKSVVERATAIRQFAQEFNWDPATGQFGVGPGRDPSSIVGRARKRREAQAAGEDVQYGDTAWRTEPGTIIGHERRAAKEYREPMSFEQQLAAEEMRLPGDPVKVQYGDMRGGPQTQWEGPAGGLEQLRPGQLASFEERAAQQAGVWEAPRGGTSFRVLEHGQEVGPFFTDGREALRAAEMRVAEIQSAIPMEESWLRFGDQVRWRIPRDKDVANPRGGELLTSDEVLREASARNRSFRKEDKAKAKSGDREAQMRELTADLDLDTASDVANLMEAAGETSGDNAMVVAAREAREKLRQREGQAQAGEAAQAAKETVASKADDLDLTLGDVKPSEEAVQVTRDVSTVPEAPRVAPSEKGVQQPLFQTGSRVAGDSPRATGRNPRALGTNRKNLEKVLGLEADEAAALESALTKELGWKAKAGEVLDEATYADVIEQVMGVDSAMAQSFAQDILRSLESTKAVGGEKVVEKSTLRFARPEGKQQSLKARLEDAFPEWKDEARAAAHEEIKTALRELEGVITPEGVMRVLRPVFKTEEDLKRFVNVAFETIPVVGGADVPGAVGTFLRGIGDQPGFLSPGRRKYMEISYMAEREGVAPRPYPGVDLRSQRSREAYRRKVAELSAPKILEKRSARVPLSRNPARRGFQRWFYSKLQEAPKGTRREGMLQSKVEFHRKEYRRLEEWAAGLDLSLGEKRFSKTSAGAWIDTANQFGSLTAILLRPGYVPPNLLGQILFASIDHYWNPIAMNRSYRLHRSVLKGHPELDAMLRRVMGEGMYAALPPAGAMRSVARVHKGLSKFYAKILDTPFRHASFFNEAYKWGYTSPEQLRALIRSAENPGRSPGLYRDFLDIAQEANRNIVDYARLNQAEQRIIKRVIFFYPWIKGSTVYTARFLGEHPGQALAMAQSGRMERERAEEMLGAVPSYLRGIVPVTKVSDSPLGFTGAKVFNPQAVSIFGSAGDVLMSGLSMIGGGARAGDQPSEMLNPLASAVLAAFTRIDPFTGSKYEATASAPGIFAQEMFQNFTGMRALQAVLPQQYADALAGMGLPQSGAVNARAGRTDWERVLLPYQKQGPKWLPDWLRAEEMQRYLTGITPYSYNVTEGQQRAFSEKLGLESKTERKRLLAADQLKRTTQVARQLGVIGKKEQLPKQLREAVQLDTRRQMEYEALAAERGMTSGNLTPLDRLEADLNLLVRMGRMPAGYAKELLLQYSSFDNNTIGGLRSRIGDTYFSKSVINEWNRLLLQVGASRGLNLNDQLDLGSS